MVGPLLLLKILHCKKKNQKSRKHEETASQGTSNASSRKKHSHTIKKESDNTPICRICLKEGNIPIFDENKSEEIPEALVAFGGIDIKKDDAYPKHLCSTCHALLQGAILFRKTAQESDQILKKPPGVQQNSNDDNYYDMEMDNDDDFHIPSEKGMEYYCKRCNMDFKTLEEYSDHTMSEDHETRRRSCPICNKSLTAVYYKKHVQLHKLETPTHMCDICGKTFLVPGQFTRHRVTHFYELPFKCSLCPYRGRFSESLRLHMRQHTGEKPYQCSECAHRCVSRSNLTKHMRTHTKARNYNCEMCGRGFYTQKTLQMHLSIDHTGIKDHVCNVCGKAFGYRKQMMKHQLKVHKRQKLRSGRLPLYLQVEMKKNGPSQGEELRENEESES